MNGNESIKELMIIACEICRKKTGKELKENWNEENYEGLTKELNDISQKLPTTHPEEFGTHTYLLITNVMVRDARMKGTTNPKRWFRAALNLYVYGSITPPPRPEEADGTTETEVTTETEGAAGTQEPLKTEGTNPKPGSNMAATPITISINENIGIIALIVASILGLLLAILFIVRDPIAPQLSKTLNILTEVLNITVLFSFFAVIQSTNLNFKNLSKLASILKIEEAVAIFNIIRVNKTIGQLIETIRWFIIFLLLFYFLNLLEDWNPNRLIERYHLFIDFFENLFNAVSAAFIYFGFKILYDKTLDDKNNTQSYHMGTLLFLLIFIISEFSLLFLIYTGDSGVQIKISNQYNLACGIYNGLAMILLFGRLIAMEYFFKDKKPVNTEFSKHFFHNGAIFILPFYALANCLYGVQEFEQFPALKPLIFYVCFIGKGFFLLFIYHYIKFRWLHIYLHMILANNSTPDDIIGLMTDESGE